MNNKEQDWDLIIKSSSGFRMADFVEVWNYRDLVLLFVRRDFVSVYKQTILGPLWFFIQPILTSLTFTIIFGEIAGVSTDGCPPLLYYLSGLVLWNYFAESLTKISSTFITNASVFSKVYFPRLAVPVSILLSNIIKLALQFLIFLAVWLFYAFKQNSFQLHYELIPVFLFLILLTAGYGFCFGIIISSLTTKYKDLTFLVNFGVQLLMYASAVVVPLSIMSDGIKKIVLLNPLVSIIESFKYIFLNTGFFSYSWLLYDLLLLVVLMIISLGLFFKVERTFVDTV